MTVGGPKVGAVVDGTVTEGAVVGAVVVSASVVDAAVVGAAVVGAVVVRRIAVTLKMSTTLEELSAAQGIRHVHVANSTSPTSLTYPPHTHTHPATHK